MYGDLMNRISDKGKFIIREGRMEGEPYPSGFLRKITMIDLIRDFSGPVMADMEQIMSIGACADASSPDLDPEPVAQ